MDKTDKFAMWLFACGALFGYAMSLAIPPVTAESIPHRYAGATIEVSDCGLVRTWETTEKFGELDQGVEFTDAATGDVLQVSGGLRIIRYRRPQ